MYRRKSLTDKNARCGYLSLVLSKPSRALHTVEPDENMYGPDACLWKCELTCAIQPIILFTLLLLAANPDEGDAPGACDDVAGDGSSCTSNLEARAQGIADLYHPHAVLLATVSPKVRNAQIWGKRDVVPIISSKVFSNHQYISSRPFGGNHLSKPTPTKYCAGSHWEKRHCRLHALLCKPGWVGWRCRV